MRVTIECKSLMDFEGKKLNEKFPGMNEMIAAAKRGKFGYQPYNDMKIYYQSILAPYFINLPKFDKVKINIEWHEPNARRDIDNICAGTKFIMDALVNAKIITDDSQKYVKGINHEFYVDKHSPRIVIEILGV